jgi:hypothetical protein
MFMSAQPAQAALHDDPGQQAADARIYRTALHDLVSMGTDLARLLHGQATAQAQAAQEATAPRPAPAPAPGAPIPNAPFPGAPVPDTLVSIAAAFDRAARAVRRGILLARSLAHPIQPAPDPARHRAAARRRILREVEDAIHRPGTGGNGRDSDGRNDAGLRAELRDRMDAPDLDDDIASRPIAEIVTELRRDLGLASLPGDHPWKRRTPDDIRQLCARAAAPSVPRGQPGAGPQGPRLQDPRHGAAQRPPDLQPDKPAAVPPAQPGPTHAGPTHAGNGPPDDPAAIIATILRHATRAHGQWRPPPEA